MNNLWVMWIRPATPEVMPREPGDKTVDSVDNRICVWLLLSTGKVYTKSVTKEGGIIVFPVLFEIGPVTIYTYGVMMVLGFWAAVLAARRLAPQVGIDPEGITDLAIVAILGGLAGSYVNYIISYDWSQFTSNPAGVFRFWEGGLVFMGGLIGGTIFAIIYLRKKKMPFWEVADITAVAIPLAYGFGRIGCFFAGCCHGVPTHLPWGVIFPVLGDNVPRHPTQLYSMLLGFALAAFALWLRKRRSFAGQSFLLYLILYSIGRGLIELLRINPTVLGTPLSVAQFTGAIIIVVAGILYPILRRKNAYTDSRTEDDDITAG